MRTDTAHEPGSLIEARHLFVAERGGMLRLVRRSSGWWLELAREGGQPVAISVTDDEAARLQGAAEEAGLRV